jgi:hypothetical protein
MVRRRSRENRPSKTLTDFKMIVEPIFLAKEQNKERLEKLADLLLECFANAKRKCKKIGDNASNASRLLEVNYDEIFGLA